MRCVESEDAVAGRGGGGVHTYAAFRTRSSRRPPLFFNVTSHSRYGPRRGRSVGRGWDDVRRQSKLVFFCGGQLWKVEQGR